MLVVLESLGPEQRAVFVLREDKLQALNAGRTLPEWD